MGNICKGGDTSQLEKKSELQRDEEYLSSCRNTYQERDTAIVQELKEDENQPTEKIKLRSKRKVIKNDNEEEKEEQKEDNLRAKPVIPSNTEHSEEKNQISPIDRIKQRKPKLQVNQIDEETFLKLCEEIPNFDSILSSVKPRLEQITENDSFLTKIPLTEFTNEEGDTYIYGGSIDNNGNINGYGRLFVKDTNSYYEGEFLGNSFNGKGLLINGKGDYYFGDWKNGEAFGDGEIQFNSGSKFKGSFKNSFKEGEGKEIHVNGDIYQGNYYQNERNGDGAYVFVENDQKECLYKGEFVKGKMNDPRGAIQWIDERNYVGNIKDGEIEGTGLMKYPDGSCYKGEFKGDNKEGNGIYQWANGDILYGYWENNMLQGNAVLDTNNERYNLVYNNDTLVNYAKNNAIRNSFHTANAE